MEYARARECNSPIFAIIYFSNLIIIFRDTIRFPLSLSLLRDSIKSCTVKLKYNRKC